ncbi:MAG: alpha/beta fold hydrolase [Candidatus Dormibacteria bacterium]|jgi:pimeloyl-ACP methyl ester carboxylesterase
MSDHEVVSRVAVDRMIVTGHRIEVPLDWSRPGGTETISVFAREVVAAEKADDRNLPMICWYQGGPGMEFAFPTSRGAWLEQLLTRYRVLLLDQRGTGMSAPLEARSLPRSDPGELAEYLRHFRADSIVRDAERFRAVLLGEEADWQLFGQSFGGFCSLTHLSLLPEHVTGVIITGGFAPVLHDAGAVYAALAERMVERNADFLARFPEDAERLRRIVDHLSSTEDVDAHGERLTARAFLTLGTCLGHLHGAAEVHDAVERAAHDLDALGMLGGGAHQQVAGLMSPAANPIYSLLQEACYTQGGPARWAAARVIEADPRYRLDALPAPCLTGEMVFPWMFEEWASLRPLRAAAEVIATQVSWTPLYDVDRLRANRVPVVGTVYWNDPYVERALAMETAGLLGNCEVWITNEHEHQAYRVTPGRVAERLFAMLDQRRAQSRPPDARRPQGDVRP